MTARSRRPVPAVVATALAVGLLLGACSSDSEEAAPGSSVASSATVAGPSTASTADDPSTTTTTYVVPSIPASATAEICAASKAVADAADELTALLTPALTADDSPAADQALIALLPKTTPIVEKAKGGYERLGAALPGQLADDARRVSETTVKIYADIAAVKSITELQEVIEARRGDDRLVRDSSARLEATVRQTCNFSLYGS